MDDKNKLNKATLAVQTATAAEGKLLPYDLGLIFFRHGCYEKAADCFREGNRANDSRCSTMLACLIFDNLINDPKYQLSLNMDLQMEAMAGGQYYPDRAASRPRESLLFKAANQGNTRAMILIPYYRVKDPALYITDEEAEFWLTKAADAGVPEAMEVIRRSRRTVFSGIFNAVKNTFKSVLPEEAEDKICDAFDDTIEYKN